MDLFNNVVGIKCCNRDCKTCCLLAVKCHECILFPGDIPPK
jgi:hypothetical protein